MTSSKTRRMIRMRRVLVIDVGGSHIKFVASHRTDERKFSSGRRLTAKAMAARVKRMTKDWTFDAVSIGLPAVVVHGRPVTEPHNLGGGWVGFDFAEAFGCPVKIINDAAMQALGSYTGGRMLFLGLGTGLGSAMIVDGIIEPMELAHLPYRKGDTFEDRIGASGLEKSGKKKWRKAVADVVKRFTAVLQPEYVVIGGGNAEHIKRLPPRTLLGGNEKAFEGGLRLWTRYTA